MSLRVFVFLVLILNFIQGVCTPIIDDEAYYWMWSQRLSFGYFDHPPMVALWIKLSDMFLKGEIGTRFITIIINVLGAYFYWKIANPITKRERLIFSLIYFCIPFIHLFSFISTPDSPLLFFTILYLYVLKNYLARSTWKWSLLLGICFAGIMYSKYHGVLVIAFTLIPVLTSLYKKPSFYGAIILSLILYSPHFYWLYENNFPPIQYHFIDRSAEEKFTILHPIIYIGTAIGAFAGLLMFYIIPAIRNYPTKNPFNRSLYWLVIGPFVFFFISTLKDTTQAQWLLISYIALGIILYEYLKNIKQLKLFYYLAGITAVGLLFVRICIMIPSISPLYETKHFGEMSGKLAQNEIVAFEKYQEASIFQFYNRDKRGVVYRTIGNRNSQFTLWDDENYLAQSFTYISPWVESLVSFEGLKKKKYFVNVINGYKPIHHSEVIWKDQDEKQIEIKKGQSIQLKFQLNKLEGKLLLDRNVDVALYLTQEKQYNIVEEIPVSIEHLQNPYELKSGYVYEIEINPNVEPGEYAIYVGLRSKGLPAKYQSKPIKLVVSE